MKKGVYLSSRTKRNKKGKTVDCMTKHNSRRVSLNEKD